MGESHNRAWQTLDTEMARWMDRQGRSSSLLLHRSTLEGNKYSIIGSTPLLMLYNVFFLSFVSGPSTRLQHKQQQQQENYQRAEGAGVLLSSAIPLYCVGDGVHG